MAENEPKKETVRITLPTRPAVGEGGPAAPVKKETVRINLPSRPTLGSTASAGTDAPKKESSKLSNLAKPPVLPPKPMAPPPPGAMPRPAAPAPSATAPLRPSPAAPGGAPAAPRPPAAPSAAGAAPAAPRPPGVPGAVLPPSATAPLRPAPGVPGGAPRPPGAPAAPGAPKPPGAPGSITRPMAPLPKPGGAPVAPKPPGAPVGSADETAVPGAGPSLFKKPDPASAADSAATVVSPTPKKDTVRIEVPKTAAKPPVPATTVKMQTQPLQPRPPAAEVRTLPASSAVVTTSGDVVEDDPMVKYAAIGVLVFSVLVFLSQVLNYLSLKVD